MDAELNSDMWATAESSSELVALYGRVRAHSDATIDALQPDSPGTVPHWSGDRAHVTLHLVLVHVTAEVNRHGGQADIVRELIDGAVGLRVDNDNMGMDARDRAQYRDTLEQVPANFCDAVAHESTREGRMWPLESIRVQWHCPTAASRTTLGAHRRTCPVGRRP